MNPKFRKTIRLLAAVYAALMLYLLFFRRNPFSPAPLPHLDVNLVPLRTINRYLFCLTPPLNSRNVRWAVINFFGNVIMFLPLGFLPPLLWSWARKLPWTLLFSLGVMTVVEVLQMLLQVGVCDVDDLILNPLGAAIGYGCYAIYRHKKEHL